MPASWYGKSLEEIYQSLATTPEGLSAKEAARRLVRDGRNSLPQSKRDSLLTIFLRQFESPLIYVLFGAAAVIFFIGEPVDAAIILGVLLFNALLGTLQEGRAQQTLSALKNFVETKATVLREGSETIIPDAELVVGDVVVLQEGERVPADARVIKSSTLRVDEAALTGESMAVHKVETPLLPQKNLSVAEQKNMLFRGTYVVAGNGKALVVAVGERTVIGELALEIASVDTEVPLKKNIRALSRLIVIVVALMSTALFALGLLQGRGSAEMFATVVALAVSVIPEGLPIVITLVLATGVWRMSKRQALVKKLQAVEALGQARVIAVDKTGTITKNELTVERVWVGENEFEIGGVGYEPKGEVRLLGERVEPANHEELLFMGKIAAFCANARVIWSEAERRYRISGDPTEAAMRVLGEKLGFHKDTIEHEAPQLSEVPFDYKYKFHATVHQDGKERFLTVVGAPEVVLRRSQRLWQRGKSVPLELDAKNKLDEVLTTLSRKGLRVVGVSYAKGIEAQHIHPEHLPPLTFVGFFGMKDALREEVAQAMHDAHEAGIKVVMITGDHKATAQALATEAGIYREGDGLLTGEEIDALSQDELAAKLKGVSVFARVTPEHKLRIIEGFKARGEIIAMTGDGVNDAPSLVAADLGVAMGTIGTEVAREAADIILLDDNFGSIVAAVEEGRNMYRAIKKVVLYLFSTSVGEVATIVGALFLALPLPLLPAQIIWLNFVTDPFLDAALGMEPKEKSLLRGTFAKPKKYIVDSLMLSRIILMAIPMAIGALLLFSQYAESDMQKALTMSLTVLAVFQWFNAWNCRSEDQSVFSHNPLKSPLLLLATGVVFVLQMFAVYHPFFQSILHTTALSLMDWVVIVPIAFSIIIVEELRKYLYRAWRKRRVSGSQRLQSTPRIVG